LGEKFAQSDHPDFNRGTFDWSLFLKCKLKGNKNVSFDVGKPGRPDVLEKKSPNGHLKLPTMYI
jgi:hypothetical protein